MYSVPTVIETERLLLRRFKTSDKDAFTRLMTTSEVTQFLAFPNEMKTQEGAKQLLDDTIESYGSNKPFFALAIEDKVTGTFLGCCGVNPLTEETVEIFYAVVPKQWGRGIATEVAGELTAYLFEKWMVKTIKAFIVPGHQASIRVVEKIGFHNSGLVENPNFEQKVHQYVLDSKNN